MIDVAQQYKCPNCGGGLEFSAASQKFACPYCLSAFKVKELKEGEKPQKPSDNPVDELEVAENEPQITFQEAENCDEFAEHTQLYHCPSCGAEVIADEHTAASMCHYCHSAVLLSGRLSGKYLPAGVIPFRKTMEEAKAAYHEWSNKLWFTPSDYKSEASLEKLVGVYLPFWLADCSLNANLTALGRHVRSWREGDYEVTEVKEFLVERSGYFDFTKVPADGSSKAEDSLMNAIEPFDYSALTGFNGGYLSGYMAEKYDVESNDVLPRVKDRIDDAARQSLMSTVIGYTSVSVTGFMGQLARLKWTYALLPVYMLTYKYRDKDYTFAINGQTGRLAGSPPLSWPKALVAGGIVAVLAMIAALLIGGWILWLE